MTDAEKQKLFAQLVDALIAQALPLGRYGAAYATFGITCPTRLTDKELSDLTEAANRRGGSNGLHFILSQNATNNCIWVTCTKPFNSSCPPIES